MGSLHRHRTAGIPGSTLSLTAQRGERPAGARQGSTGRSISATPRGLRSGCALPARASSMPPATHGARRYPIPVRAAVPTASASSRSGHPESPRPSRIRVGFQRASSKDTALEVRYVGTRGINLWGTEAYNERNLIENGFIDEFKAAMGNLQAQRGRRLRRQRPGRPARSRIAAPAPARRRCRSTWRTSDRIEGREQSGGVHRDELDQHDVRRAAGAPQPEPDGSRPTDLDGDADAPRQRAGGAGLPANFFVLNPDVAERDTSQTSNGSSTTTTRCRFELRRRLSHGLQLNGSYVFATAVGLDAISDATRRLRARPDREARPAAPSKFQWN